MPDTKKYCYRNPKFPENAFVGMVLTKINNNINVAYPIQAIYNTLDDFRNDAVSIKSQLGETQSVSSSSIIMPISKKSLFPLRREYWENPTTLIHEKDRIDMFASALKRYMLYNLLVTPYKKLDHNKELFSAAIPLYKTTTNSILEQFMYHSFFPVDESAKYAAIYSIQKPIGFNWKNGQFIPSHKFFLKTTIN